MRTKLFLALCFVYTVSFAQFPGPAGTTGTTAMFADSSAFVAWASGCHVSRGLMDISTPSLGLTTVGDSSMALDKAGTNGVVSLGDGGYAIVTFSVPIKNGTGFDFAVFENAFNDSFLELAFVEVSSDGINFFRFPAESNLPVSPQYDGSANMDATRINNLAGKYRALYGTPFDLQELTGIPLLNINEIRHVKIIDVVGSINPTYATYDKNNTIINDPWTTAFPSGGFDLDAIGVIHQGAVGINEMSRNISLKIYPNPATSKFIIENTGSENEKTILKIVNTLGAEILHEELVTDNTIEVNVSRFNEGIYFLHFQGKNSKSVYKLIKE